jgi:Tol biopolymer transport system component
MGDSIAYTSVSLDQKPVTFNLMILDMDNGYSKQLMVTKMNVDEIAWSPDGQQIVFSSSSYNTFDLKECDEDLYIVNRDGSDLRRLTDYPGSVRSPTWSPDGQWIVFETSRICGSGGQWQINLIKVDGGWVNEVGSSSSLQMNPAFPPVPDWSPLPALQIGKIFSITASGAQLKLRASPSTTGDVLDKLNKGDRILVLEGPTVAEEYLWWRVRLNDSGREGWVAENPGWFAGSDSNLP